MNRRNSALSHVPTRRVSPASDLKTADNESSSSELVPPSLTFPTTWPEAGPVYALNCVL